MAEMVKNPPAMQETQVQSLGREDPLENGMATHSNVFAWGIPWTRSLWATVCGVSKSWTRLSNLVHMPAKAQREEMSCPRLD